MSGYLKGHGACAWAPGLHELPGLKLPALENLALVAVIRRLADECYELLSLRRLGAGALRLPARLRRTAPAARQPAAMYRSFRRAEYHARVRLQVLRWVEVRAGAGALLRVEGYGFPDDDLVRV
jgi:hypothetical protein